MVRKWITMMQISGKFLARNKSGQSVAQSYRAKVTITQGSFLKHHQHCRQHVQKLVIISCSFQSPAGKTHDLKLILVWTIFVSFLKPENDFSES